MLLIIGACIISVGFSIFMTSFNLIAAGIPNMSILMINEVIEAGNLASIQVPLESANEIFVGLKADPDDIPLLVEIENLNGEKISEFTFEGNIVESLGKITQDEYVFTLSNNAQQTVLVSGLLSADPSFTDLQKMYSLALPSVIALLFLFSGIIVVIVGIIIFVKERKSPENIS